MPVRDTLELIVKATTRAAQTGLRGLQSGFTRLRDKIANGRAALENFMGGMAQMRMGIDIIKNLTQPAIDLETAMIRAGVTSRATADEFARMGDIVENLAKESKLYSEIDVANALKALTEAGFTASQAMTSLEYTLDLATVAGVDTTQSANMLKEAIVSYGMEATDAARVSDVLSATFLKTGTSIQDQVSAITFMGQMLAALNIPIEETSAFIGVLGDLGVKGTRAMSSFGSAMGDMIDPNTQLNETMKNAGVRVDEFADGTIGLVELVESMGDAFDAGRLTAQDLAVVLDGRAAVAFTALGRNSEYVSTTLEENTSSMGSTAQAAGELEAGVSASSKEMQKSFEDLKVEMGEALMPVLIPTLDLFKEMINVYEALPAPIKAAVPALILLAGGMMILGAAMMFLNITSAKFIAIAFALIVVFTFLNEHGSTLEAVMGTLAVAVIGLGIALLFASKTPIVAIIFLIITGVILLLPWIIKLTKALFGSGLHEAFTKVSEAASIFLTPLRAIVDLFQEIIGLAGGVGAAIEKIPGAKQIMAAGGKVTGGVGRVLGFQAGGEVPGPRGAPVPAVVHGGEKIIPVDEADEAGAKIIINVSGTAEFERKVIEITQRYFRRGITAR